MSVVIILLYQYHSRLALLYIQLPTRCMYTYTGQYRWACSVAVE